MCHDSTTACRDSVAIREQVIRTCFFMRDRLGYFVGTWGNISVRLDDGLLVTPSRTAYEDMTPEDLVVVKWQGGVLRGKRLPTSETELHRQILLARPDLVDAAFSTLPPQRFSLLDALKKNYPLRLGNKTGYIGSPAAATKEFGEAARRLLTEAAWEVARPVFEVEDDSWQRTSMLYKIPFMRTAFPYIAGGTLLLLAGLAVWLWLR